MIDILFNITERNNLYFNESEMVLIFNPGNEDVGWHHIEVKITDNNETPLVYISQDIKIQVLNVNDPPIVEIVQPINGTRYKVNEAINFSCDYSDPDLLITNSDEILTFTWTASTKGIPLGSGEFLTNLSGIQLGLGIHEITVLLKDNAGVTSEDKITIFIEEKEEKVEEKAVTDVSTINSWILFIVLLIIVIIIIAVIIYRRKKLERREVEHLPPTEDKSALPGTFVAKPGAIAPPTVSMEQVGSPAPSRQLPSSVVVDMTTQPSPIPDVPTAVSQPSDVGVPHPIATPPVIKPVAQLPPKNAEVSTTKSGQLPITEKFDDKSNLTDNREVLDQLKELGMLKREGVLTKDEFEKKKHELLK
jgi:hypothetical protein